MSARQESRLQRTARRVACDPATNGGKDPDDPWGFLAAHRKLAVMKQAALTMVAFARELAGTADNPPSEVEPPEGPPPRVAPPQAAPIDPALQRRLPQGPPPDRPKRRWDKDHRPGPSDILTWEEAMQVPWLDPWLEEHSR